MHTPEKRLISVDEVYIRSLSSNNTPSTTKAKWKDWPQIMEICFDNREADIGRFFRRHLGGITPDVAKGIASVLVSGMEPEPTREELLKTYLQEGRERCYEVVEERQIELPEHGSWEVALQIIGEVPTYSANQNFLSLLYSNNPKYSGWPTWVDSRSFTPNEQPYVHNDAWEALIAPLDYSWGIGIDFLRLDPKGKFYLYRSLADDFFGGERGPQPLTRLDFSLPITLTVEAMAVGIAFAGAMGCEPEDTILSFAFCWSGLRGRELSSWVNPRRFMFPGQIAYQDDVIVYSNVPLNTPLSALAEYAYQVTQPLFEIFGGFALDRNVVEDLTRNLIERRR